MDPISRSTNGFCQGLAGLDTVGICVDDLLRRPFGRRVLRHVEVHDAAALVRQHQEYEQDPSGHRRNGKEIHRCSQCDVVREEGSPRL